MQALTPTTLTPATLTHGPADDLGRPISSATGSADLALYPLEDLGGLVRTAFRAGDPTRPGLAVCDLAHWLPADERRRLSALIARAPEMADEIERLRAERGEARAEVERMAARWSGLYETHQSVKSDRDALISEIAHLRADKAKLAEAVERQVANIERWLETGEAADADESKSIYDQLVAALAAAKGD
ncbi:hypothetical protein [Phaeospirillum tilakii]|uniref:Uncharacterized protein n=1 Tax=Phaeospirillum tilakii TaxID=741673 RepID=A0ABW5CEH1_9PROT